jgi:hypothetical protein
MTAPRNHTGQTFGAVEVLERVSDDNPKRRIDYRVRWRCCGTEAVPQWGLLFPLVGPFGHRHSAHNTHAAERK